MKPQNDSELRSQSATRASIHVYMKIGGTYDFACTSSTYFATTCSISDHILKKIHRHLLSHRRTQKHIKTKKKPTQGQTVIKDGLSSSTARGCRWLYEWKRYTSENAAAWVNGIDVYRRLHRKSETENSEPRLQRHACRKEDCAGGHVGPGLCTRSWNCTAASLSTMLRKHMWGEGGGLLNIGKYMARFIPRPLHSQGKLPASTDVG